MKSSFILLLSLMCVVVTKAQTADRPPLVVMVQYTAQPGKGAEAVSALKLLLADVKKEPHYVGIRMLVKPGSPESILLYEQWSDAAYFRGEHMQTPHLQAFIASSRAFLAGPPEISFWQAAD